MLRGGVRGKGYLRAAGRVSTPPSSGLSSFSAPAIASLISASSSPIVLGERVGTGLVPQKGVSSVIWNHFKLERGESKAYHL